MTRTAKAAIYTAPNEPFVVKDYPLRPVAAGEVLVRVRMSTICRSDIHSYEGKRPNPCPGILGHEIIGTRSEEHTSELQSLMRISYAVFCLKKKNTSPITSRYRQT